MVMCGICGIATTAICDDNSGLARLPLHIDNGVGSRRVIGRSGAKAGKGYVQNAINFWS